MSGHTDDLPAPHGRHERHSVRQGESDGHPAPPQRGGPGVPTEVGASSRPEPAASEQATGAGQSGARTGGPPPNAGFDTSTVPEPATPASGGEEADEPAAESSSSASGSAARSETVRARTQAKTSTSTTTEAGAKYGKPSVPGDGRVGLEHRGRSPIAAQEQCESCGAAEFDVRSDEVVCRNCGLVQREDCIDHGPEWREYRDGEGQRSQRRVGPGVTELLHDRGLSTQIGFGDVDANGNPISAEQRNLFNRLREWQSRINATSSRARNLKHALGEIQRVTFALDLSKAVAARAARIYRNLLDREAIRGWSIESIAAVSVYVVVREDRLPVTLKEVEAVARDENVNMNRAYLHAVQELGASIHPQFPADFLPRILSELDAPPDVRVVARRLVELAREEGLVSGKEPNGVAGGAVYLAHVLSNRNEVTQEEVSEAAHVCIVTVRARRDDLWELLDEERETAGDLLAQH